ncbi:MAG: response regulator transcription factor [Chloroflexi bacterium]|nr:response regulator transcription factor [Chloroflexota bacterium]
MLSYILILETDDGARRSIVELFQNESFDVVEEVDSSDGITRVMQNSPDIIVMSEDMPPLDGVELLPLMRRLTSAPIIVLGLGGEVAVVKALMDGADMYLQKPLNYRELLSRARAMFRRTEEKFEAPSSEVSEVNQISLEDQCAQEFGVLLTNTEAKLLRCLSERSDQVVGYQELMMRVWGKPVGKGRLRFYIHSLRRKLGETVSINLHTQKGIGYRLMRSPSLNV